MYPRREKGEKTEGSDGRWRREGVVDARRDWDRRWVDIEGSCCECFLRGTRRIAEERREEVEGAVLKNGGFLFRVFET